MPRHRARPVRDAASASAPRPRRSPRPQTPPAAGTATRSRPPPAPAPGHGPGIRPAPRRSHRRHDRSPAPVGIPLGKAQRLHEFAFLERARQKLGRPCRAQLVQPPDIAARHQHDQSRRPRRHRLGQRRHRPQPLVPRPARIHDRHRRTAHGKPPCRVVRLPAGHHRPARRPPPAPQVRRAGAATGCRSGASRRRR